MASMYSAKVMEHFANPHNVGEIPDANGVGEVGNPKCGDIMRMYLKIENNVIVDVKFLTFGCGAARPLWKLWKVCLPSRCTARSWQSRLSRLPCLTTTAVRASIRNPSWVSSKRTATTARAAATDPRKGRFRGHRFVRCPLFLQKTALLYPIQNVIKRA